MSLLQVIAGEGYPRQPQPASLGVVIFVNSKMQAMHIAKISAARGDHVCIVREEPYSLAAARRALRRLFHRLGYTPPPAAGSAGSPPPLGVPASIGVSPMPASGVAPAHSSENT